MLTDCCGRALPVALHDEDMKGPNRVREADAGSGSIYNLCSSGCQQQRYLRSVTLKQHLGCW